MFSSGGVNSSTLSKLIKDVILQLDSCGLDIIGTVCDQGAANQGAMKILISSSPTEYAACTFTVNNKSRIVLYDPPHLLKGIRNQLLKKNLIWKTDNEKLTASWSHIKNAYYIDVCSGDLRALRKITEEHITEEKMKKMKVAHCAQVLSHTMAATISMMARNNEISSDGTVTMPKEAIATDKILKFFDNLFDSVNGSLRINSEGKPLKMVAKSTSDHRNFWIDSIKHLGNMWFEDHIKKTRSIPPSLKNWVTTLKGMLSILCYVERKKLPFFIPRQINQDPLENMFGQIRQMRGRNINPTCQGFGDAFKSLLVRKMLSPHLAGGNCEEDNSKNLLKPTVFLNKSDNPNMYNAVISDVERPLSPTQRNIETSLLEVEIERTVSPSFELDGRRIVDVSSFMNQICEIGYHNPFNCSVVDMHIISEQRNGLSSQITLQCKMCGIQKKITTDSINTSKINDSVVLVATSIGIGYSQADEFFSVLDIPFMANKTYNNSHDNIAHIIHDSALKSMEEAAKEEAEIAKNIGDVDKNGIPCITVVVGGSWSKRSYNVNYNALSGVVSAYCVIICLYNRSTHRKVVVLKHK
nr:uncharacterized protein LOC111422910 [Onthophagus taurus]